MSPIFDIGLHFADSFRQNVRLLMCQTANREPVPFISATR